MIGSVLFEKKEFPVVRIPELEPRADDLRLFSPQDILDLYRNDLEIYEALLRLAKTHGTQRRDGRLVLQIGYKSICAESGCSKRALGRAWKRLIAFEFLVQMNPYVRRNEYTYVIRTREMVAALYSAAGVTGIRVNRQGIRYQPFRPAATVVHD